MLSHLNNNLHTQADGNRTDAMRPVCWPLVHCSSQDMQEYQIDIPGPTSVNEKTYDRCRE